LSENSHMKTSVPDNVQSKFNDSPPRVRKQLMRMRKIILETASDLDLSHSIEETLKWGEPSFVAPKGSAVRLSWKAKDPDRYRLCFHCQTTLVATFREIHPDSFSYENNRAMVFDIADTSSHPAELKDCIGAALRYHELKHLPDLGLA